jgi:hypothetical protein
MDCANTRLASRARELCLIVPGRLTHSTRRVTLWFSYQNGCLYLLAHARRHGKGTHWYRNLQVAGRAIVEIEGACFDTILDDVGDSTSAIGLIRELFREKYGEVAVAEWYAQTDRIPVVLRICSESHVP